MDSIRIENLRSLADTRFVDLKPITLLLGQNNSGKSTFLRAIPLLRQSVESRTTGPILWYGQFVDYGGFSVALNTKAEKREIGFHFRFRLSARDVARYPRLFLQRGRLWGYVLLEDADVTLTLRLSRAPKGELTYASECSLDVAGHTVRMTFDSDGSVTNLLVNSRDLSDEGRAFRTAHQSGLVPQLVPRDAETRTLDPLARRLMKQVRRHVHANTSAETVRHIAWGLGIGSSRRMLDAMPQSRAATKVWRERTSIWTTESGEFQRLRDLVIAANLRAFLLVCDEYVEAFARNSSYVPPVRATAERYYRLQNLAVDEVDFQGRNLAMFLRSLTDTERKRFSQWTDKHFGFSSFARAVPGHISLTIREADSVDEFNLTDKGFGFSQMLPILTQLWVVSSKGRRGRSQVPSRQVYLHSPLTSVPITFAIEQPELHLHPHLQATIADSFLDSIAVGRESGLDIRLIIETHSATIVNRLGHRIANGDIAPEDICVAIFEKASADAPTEVRIGQYDQEGFLTNWPFGFFEPDKVQ